MIKGPKGMGSFLVLSFVASKIKEIIEPKTNDKSIFKRINLSPKTKPKAPMRVTSPPPIPPVRRTIRRKKPPAMSRPPRLVKMLGFIS